MKLHLNHTPTPFKEKIHHKDKIMMIGSCFAENVGDYLNKFKFNCLVNPNGILFNPKSISNALTSYQNNSAVDKDSIIKSGELFYSLNHHGDFHSESEVELNVQIKTSQAKASSFLKNGDWLIITFGSAFVYRHLKTNSVVANCHKIPQQVFKKELLTSPAIVEEYNSLIKDLQKQNSGLKIILTVSPVKYLRDGVEENSLSKAILIQSVHEIIKANTNCFYFPAYELVTDDLRDYRFYKEDLAHPNNAAIKYVWDKFSETVFSNETKKLNEKFSEIIKAIEHRPITINSNQHNAFKISILQKCADLEKEFDFLDFTTEKEKLSSQ